MKGMLVSFIIGLVIGYGSHYLFSNDEGSSLTPDVNAVHQRDNNALATIDLSAESTHTANEQKQAQLNQKAVAMDKMKVDGEIAKKENNLTSQKIKNSLSVNKRAEILANDPSLTSELAAWSASHKTHINELISAHMSDNTAEHMKGQIFPDNDFLSNPEIKQEANVDEAWAFAMEQDLALFFEQHELSDKFQLLNVSCKQLMCDVVGIDKDKTAWTRIYMSLLRTVPQVIFPDKNNPTKNIIYYEGDTAIIYTQIRFKSAQ